MDFKSIREVQLIGKACFETTNSKLPKAVFMKVFLTLLWLGKGVLEQTRIFSLTNLLILILAALLISYFHIYEINVLC